MKLIPKNWQEFQHYKDRCPPWIKLHRDLLNDRAFMCLPLASKALAPLLWLLASESKTGEFDAAIDELEFRLRLDKSDIKTGLQALINAGFFISAGGVLAECLQLATPEGEGEGEGEAEAEAEAEAGLPCPQPARQKPSTPNCPHEEIIRLWGEKLPMAIQPRTWTGERADDLKRRWREDPKRQNLDWWAGLFEHIRQSDFLMGRVEGKRGTSFVVSLDWLIKPANFAKALDGHYDRKEPAKPSLFSGGI